MTASATPADFQAARDICRRHARSFYFSSFFLPPDKREAAFAVYAFCRLLDDATDESPDADSTARQIDRFETLLDSIYVDRAELAGDSESQRALAAFAATVRRFEIPRDHFHELALGCRMDLTVTTYADWPALRQYCYRVAGVVGLMMCRIFGLAEPSAQRQAVIMGEAMQLTNILRDVKEDLQRGRIYLPADEMQRFGVTPQSLAAGTVDKRFIELMRFQIERARSLFQEGAAGLVHLPDDGSRFTAASMAVIYSGILQAIEHQQYDVFQRRARINLLQKLARLPRARRLSKRGVGGVNTAMF